MFIRYNSTAKYYEYDTSAAQNGSGPWVILPLTGHPDAPLPANVAYTDRDNNFTVGQTVQAGVAAATFVTAGQYVQAPNIQSRGNQAPIMSFDTSGPVNNRGWWFRQVNTGILYLETIDDAGTPQVQACNIERNGTWSFTSSFTSHPKGAYFPARSSNPGLLDHYEEGNWTPILFSVDGGQGTAYSGVVGVYTKIGQVVNCFFAIGLQAANWTSGLINIGGFPFTNIDTYSVGFFDYYNPTVNTIRIQMHMPPNTNAVFLPYQTVPNSNPHEAYIQASQMQTGVIFRGQITYRTNT